MKKYLIIFSLLLLISSAQATHIKGGEITLKKISHLSLTYEITVNAFRDSGSSIDFGGGTLDINGININGPFQPESRQLENGIDLVSFTHTYTFSQPNGAGYLISYREEYRNADIINIDNSVGTSFYVETLLVIDPFLGSNSSPILTYPAIDFAVVGVVFKHNPGAYDPDGDSLSYKLITPKQASDLDVEIYRFPNDPSFYSNFATGSEKDNPPSFNIDSNGNVIWDAPGDAFVKSSDFEQREYNIAYQVIEWRKVEGDWYKMGFTTRDMQIQVFESDNLSPQILSTSIFCEQAYSSSNITITANDPDSDEVSLSAHGELFEKELASFFSSSLISPARLSLNLETSCSDVRSKPYHTLIRAIDNPEFGPGLTDLQSIWININGPLVEGVRAELTDNRFIKLQWDSYSCSEAESLQVWRKRGFFLAQSDKCRLADLSTFSGFELIDEVDIGALEYIDDNHSSGLSPGSPYCYRLVALFPEPYGGRSIASDEVCSSLPIDAPIITQVDVLSTSESSGEVLIQWTPAYDIDSQLHPAPYSYDLYRKGNDESSFTKIKEGLTDVSHTDNELNTKDISYAYYVAIVDANQMMAGVSGEASTVNLTLTPSHNNSILLQWEAEASWNQQSRNQPYHYVYRGDSEDINSFELIDSIDISLNSFEYWDDGTFNNEALSSDEEYFYYVETRGSMEIPEVTDVIINTSQVANASPLSPLSAQKPTLELNIYPNPFTSEIHVESNIGFSYSVFDISGVALDNEVFKPSGKHLIELAVKSGVYLIIITLENGNTITKRVVKAE
ncbi:MAG: T9SS type A sorting domain-containing protein [Cyclobacteriaceae bacterium]